MPMYSFQRCDNEEIVDLFFHMSDAPSIGAEITVDDIQYIRLPSVGIAGIMDSSQPKTVGELAKKNTEKMVKEGDPRVKPKKKAATPWWRSSSKVNKDINTWTTKQKENYIHTGKK